MFKKFIFFILIFNNVYANEVLLKIDLNSENLINTSLKKCSKKILNPHLGSDIYKVKCSFKIKNAEENQQYKLLGSNVIQNNFDPEENDQWGLEFLNIAAMWSNGFFGSEQFPIAIIDSGLTTNHEDINLERFYNSKEIPNNGIDDDKNGYVDDYYGWNAIEDNNNIIDEFDHGTAIAGLLVSTHNNQLGIKGLIPQSKLIIVKIFGKEGGGRTEHVIKAIDYAIARGARIINFSWGGYSNSPLLFEMLKRCQEKGVMIVAAAGNESNDNDQKPFYPASFPLDNIISVASVDFRGAVSSFSNYGKKTVHISAPGESVLTTVGEHRYGYKDGSSFAAPHIAGILNLIWSQQSNWKLGELKNNLLNKCQKTTSEPTSTICGGSFKFP